MSAALQKPSTVDYDARRPWPLGLPSKEEALAAITSQAEVSASLEGSHLHVLTLFPEWVFDEARTALVDAGAELAWASASAWRAVVAFERIEGALSIDVPALVALTEEVLAARERLVGYSTFALDGGAGSAELLSMLDQCVARFVELSQVEEREPPRPTPAPRKHEPRKHEPRTPEPPTHVRLQSTPKRRMLPWLTAAAIAIALSFHLWTLHSERSQDGWVVNGSIDSGQATLVPLGPAASDATREAKIAELSSQGVSVKRSVTGEWLLIRN